MKITFRRVTYASAVGLGLALAVSAPAIAAEDEPASQMMGDEMDHGKMQKMDHGEMGQDNMDHGGMNKGVAVDLDGDWSYMGRENPAMRYHGRLEAIPIAASGEIGFRMTSKAPLAERCAALMPQNHLAIDRTLLAACGETPDPNSTSNTTHDQGKSGHDAHH
ncbi:MAG: hypothetical protein HOK61_02610 [Alphaproteobacteria bacterium]|jgi:hypothetical protein|nr:hypothetical protein [Alphaproteobacteria bacterium]